MPWIGHTIAIRPMPRLVRPGTDLNIDRQGADLLPVVADLTVVTLYDACDKNRRDLGKG